MRNLRTIENLKEQQQQEKRNNLGTEYKHRIHAGSSFLKKKCYPCEVEPFAVNRYCHGCVVKCQLLDFLAPVTTLNASQKSN